MLLVNTCYGPQVPECERTHAEKHRLPGESFEQACNRLSNHLSDNEEHRVHFRDTILGMRFAAGGRIQAAIGSGRNTTAYNCFVGDDIADSFVDDEGHIMQRATETARTMRMGGGMGNNFSSLRPRGAIIHKLGSTSSGPLPFMGVFNAVGLATSSSGHRRGAQMGVLDISHPDIIEFIKAKQNENEFKGFNFSMGVTDDFMEAKYANKNYKLHWGGKVYREIDANELWDIAMRSTWDWGEPGVLFLDTINRWNNLWYCEILRATNPCGEQPLPRLGACLLGSFNLTRYVYRSISGKYQFDWDLFILDIYEVVRAMDNVIDRTTYPLSGQEQEAKNKRRMGLGIFGLANALEALGYAYGSIDFVEMEARILDTLRDHAYAASALLAKEKGAFPLYHAEKYLKGKFIQTLSPWVIELIEQFGIRNSHLTSIAPTGTMAFTHDNASSSIEPVFSYTQERDIMDQYGKRTEIIKDYGVHAFGINGKRCQDVTIEEHLAVLSTAAKRVDSAVSKTCNVPSNMPWDDFKKVYDRAYELGCKGVTTFNPGGKRFAVLRSKDEEKKDSEPTNCTVDFKTGRKSCE
jgi:ribonucleoside-diphosphate reductase alpha chain